MVSCIDTIFFSNLTYNTSRQLCNSCYFFICIVRNTEAMMAMISQSHTDGAEKLIRIHQGSTYVWHPLFGLVWTGGFGTAEAAARWVLVHSTPNFLIQLPPSMCWAASIWLAFWHTPVCVRIAWYLILFSYIKTLILALMWYCRAYDRAALRFRGLNADINFDKAEYEEDMSQVIHSLRSLTYSTFCQNRGKFDHLTQIRTLAFRNEIDSMSSMCFSKHSQVLEHR